MQSHLKRADIKIYVGASMFAVGETWRNATLTAELEKRGYLQVYNPQRDGFEFTGLIRELSTIQRSEEAERTSKAVIYLLDMKKKTESDVMIANVDEPVDPGVIVEATKAKQEGKMVILYRTDVRTPFGSYSSDFGGLHDFVGFQGEVFIQHAMQSGSVAEGQKEFEVLVDKMDTEMLGAVLAPRHYVRKYARSVPQTAKELALAGILFGGLDTRRLNTQLREVVRRCEANKESLDALRPKIVKW
ncbi:MAG: nucleoside 2-deoxyribosyltransferase [Candidatus Micrarchaeota archaeon]|nr:nucleoside 2-deoxyribosyltransferase [Candidatus Micrarchaeota archaeon]